MVLRQRIATAIILAAIVVWATLALPPGGFALIAAIIFVLGGWEWAALAGLPRTGRLLFTAFVAAALGLAYLPGPISPWLTETVPLLALLWWAVAFVEVLRFPADNALWAGSATARSIAGALVLIPAWVALVTLHGLNHGYALLVIVLVSFADIGAYFAGRRFGRRKLAPRVSPGKSWEGLAGALVVTSGVALAAAAWLPVPDGRLPLFVLLCLLTVLVSVVGDLTESMFKRLAGAKDSGHLLPGHGGVLDRIDSLTAAAPFFAAGIQLAGWTA